MEGNQEELSQDDLSSRNSSLSPSPSPPPSIITDLPSSPDTSSHHNSSSSEYPESPESSQYPDSPFESTTTENSTSLPQSPSPQQSPPPETPTTPKMSATRESTPDSDPSSGYLSTTHAKDETDLIEALHLITDSIAQQRQLAASSILHHPLYFILLIVMFEYLYRLLYYGMEDWIIILIVFSGGVMCSLSLVKLLTTSYIEEAERVGTWTWLFGQKWVKHFGDGRKIRVSLIWIYWSNVWLRLPGGDIKSWVAFQKRSKVLMEERASTTDGDGDSESQSQSQTESQAEWERYSTWRRQNPDAQPEHDETYEVECLKDGWLRDMIFVSKFKGHVIATLVMRIVSVDTNVVPGPDAGSQGSLRDKAVIRAWTVKELYRGHGIGGEVLAYAIEFAKERGWEGPEFAGDHANSKRLWLGLFNEKMDRNDRRLRAMLRRKIKEYEVAPVAESA